MATGNILSICNRALLAIGSQSQISNLGEDSTQAAACSTLYTPTFEALARSAYWNCLRFQAVLSLLAAAPGTSENPDGATTPYPPVPWLYEYQLPANSLQARFIIPSLPTVATGTVPISVAMLSAQGSLGFETSQIPFRVAYAVDTQGNPLQTILTNQTQAQLVYTVNQPNPQIWDSAFQAAMVASLAAYLVPALALNMDLMKTQAAIADKIIMQARVRDGDEGTTSQDHIPDWIQARNAGGGSGYYGCGIYGDGWCDMSWGFV